MSEDASLKMWKVSSNAEKFTIAGKNFHQDNIVTLSFHETKPLLATGGEDEVFCVSSSDHGEVYFKSPLLESAVEAVCFGSALEALSVGTSDGVLSMYDLIKFKKLSDFQAEDSINGMRFWDAQKSFISSTIGGDLIMNGFGSKSGHVKMSVLAGEAINDFKFKGEFGIFVCGADNQVFEIDIRKGVI